MLPIFTGFASLTSLQWIHQLGAEAVSIFWALGGSGLKSAQAVQVLEASLRTSSKLDDLVIQTRAALARAELANQQFHEARIVLAPWQGRTDAVLPLARSLNEIRGKPNNPTLAVEVATLYRQALALKPNDLGMLKLRVGCFYQQSWNGERGMDYRLVS